MTRDARGRHRRVLLAIAAVLPFVVSSFHLLQLTMVVVYAIALLGLNMLTGYNGQISLGHGAFFALGAYATAILLEHTGTPYWLAVPISGAICFLAGFLFGLPALRLEGIYLALSTFALAVATPQLLKFRGFEVLDRRRAGRVRADVQRAFRSAAEMGPVALSLRARCCDAAVRPCVEYFAQRNRSCTHRDPRSSGRGGQHGDQYGALQDHDIRHQRHVHRDCRRTRARW